MLHDQLGTSLSNICSSSPLILSNQNTTLFFPQECMDKLDLRGLVSLSVDGPTVNWKLFDLFQKEQAKQYRGEEFIMLLLNVCE